MMHRTSLEDGFEPVLLKVIDQRRESDAVRLSTT